jgi:predicted transcriptional regulator
MSKAVLISIQPKWAAKIANGEKTIEVRKSCPKLETPFKVYIYETMTPLKKDFAFDYSNLSKTEKAIINGRGKVIGEFVCYWTTVYKSGFLGGNLYHISDDDFEQTCFTLFEELLDYGKGKTLYGWNISDLKIYDKPKDLSEFYDWKKCNSCKVSGYESTGCSYINCKVPAIITRPPQSWCYVEDLQECIKR